MKAFADSMQSPVTRESRTFLDDRGKALRILPSIASATTRDAYADTQQHKGDKVGKLLLFIHIAAVATWFGAGVTQLVVNPAMHRAGGATAAAWMRQTVRLGRVLFTPASVLVLITGVWMVLRDSIYDFEQAFVVIGFVAVIAGAFLGMRVYGPGSTQIAELHEAGEAAQAGQKLSRQLSIASAEVGFLLFTIWAMVERLGI